MLILPAGVGHRRITREDKGLKVIGAYPSGQSQFDMNRKSRTVADLPLPPSDPFYGENEPLVRLWRKADAKVR